MHRSDLGWKAFIDTFPDPIARYDKNYKHLYINQAIEDEIHKPASEVIGKSNRDLKIPNDEHLLSELERKVKQVFDTGETVVNFTQHEFPHGMRYYYMKLIPELRNQDDLPEEVQSVWAITRDITQLKQTEIHLKNAETNLLKQNLELNHLNNDLDTFFHTVSHDLRTPLNNIKGVINLMNNKTPEDWPLYLQMLASSTQRLSDVLTGLIEILELKNTQQQVEEVYLNDVLQTVLTEFQEPIHQTETTIDADFSLHSTLHIAKPYLESIFRNMISNAIKYRARSRAPHIQIVARPADDFVILSFQDNGQGIDLEYNNEKIFKPFYRVNSEQEGKGMGLNIVKNILERNGGKIEVKSQLGAGTLFICYIKEAK